ncbi:MAG: VanZ family protein [Vicinamibacterales bacterium]|nr:VanZ family protein [Vicinamibacterales bacterium]MDP6609402.1 VanZ family protein [Vicinamibacterales bacterium]
MWLWVPVAAHMGLIYASSSMRGSAVPSVLPDKLVHGAVYGLLGGLLLRALAGGRWAGVTAWTAAAAVAITIAYGASDEWHQSFVPGRTPELGDLVVDSLAATVVVLAVWAWSIIVASRAHATRRAGHAAPTSTERLP